MVTILDREFYLTEIVGRRVYLKTRSIGKLKDFVIQENAGKVPEVTHLLVHQPYGDPLLLLPWDKITLISNTEIVSEITSTEGYELNPLDNHIFLKDYILDKKILDMDDHEIEVVYDVKLLFQNDRLFVTDVDFNRFRILRRMGFKKLANYLAKYKEGSSISWLYVQPLPETIGSFEGNVKLNVLKENINDIHPVDLADILEELDGSQRMAVFNQIEPELASDTLEEVEPRVQRELIRSMEKERAAELINEMSPAQVADILSALPASEADEIIEFVDIENKQRVQQMIDKHDENIMLYSTQQIIKRPSETIVRDVINNYREVAGDMDVIMYVYVVNEENILQGVVDLRELIAAEPEQTLGEIMTDSLITLNPDDTLQDSVDMFTRYSFRAIPITDEQDVLLGVVSFHDIKGVKPRLD
ncbi:MAG: CBS domain-containing protein [Chlorobium sp.]|jgi:magnesium transporter|nr:MAG: magnesium transporter [Chlorobium sp.]